MLAPSPSMEFESEILLTGNPESEKKQHALASVSKTVRRGRPGDQEAAVHRTAGRFTAPLVRRQAYFVAEKRLSNEFVDTIG